MIKLMIFVLVFSKVLFSNEALTYAEKNLINHVKKSIENAEKGYSKLNPNIFGMNGLYIYQYGNSYSHKLCCFLNNICSMPNTNYLEVGVYKGLAFISSLYQNSKSINQAIPIGNWKSQTDRNYFGLNYISYLNPADFYPNINLMDKYPLRSLKEPINIYLYYVNSDDCSDDFSFSYYDKFLNDVFVVIINDWKSDKIKEKIRADFELLRYEILYQLEDLPANDNGFYVAVIRKN